MTPQAGTAVARMPRSFYETSDTSFEVEVACCAKQVIGRTSYGNYVGAGVGARSFQFAA